LVHFRGRKLRNLNTLILRNNPIRTISYVGGGGSGNQHSGGHHPTSGSANPRETQTHHHQQAVEEDWGNYNLSPFGMPKLNQQLDNEINPLDLPPPGPDEGKVMTELSPGGPQPNPPPAPSGLGLTSSIPNVFRMEVLPNLRELSLSFCQLSGELEPFPALPLTTLEISMGLKSATTLTPTVFHSLKNLEWLALDHNSLQSIR